MNKWDFTVADYIMIGKDNLVGESAHGSASFALVFVSLKFYFLDSLKYLHVHWLAYQYTESVIEV